MKNVKKFTKKNMTVNTNFGLMGGLLLTSFLVACGGGGGGGGGGNVFDAPDPVELVPLNEGDDPFTPGGIPSLYYSWLFDAINQEVARMKEVSGQGVTVAVIDSGIDRDNPNINHAISGDSIRFVDGERNSDFDDNNGHGTAMAGLIAGANFETGELYGVAPNTSILAIAANNYVGDSSYFNSVESLANAIEYAVDHDADIINLSLGGTYGSLDDLDVIALEYATSQGVIVVMATGNDGNNADPTYYAQLAGSSTYNDLGIAVTAVNEDEEIAWFASPCDVYDPRYCISAPGEDVYTLVNGSTDIELSDGTSQATAIVSGSIALLLEFFPNLTPEQAVQILLTTAKDLGDPGVDRVYGVGLVDLEAALRPIGATNLSTGEEVAGDDYVALNTSVFGSEIANAQSLTSVDVFDDYDRNYVINMSAAVVSIDDELELGESENQANAAFRYEGFNLGFANYFGFQYGNLAQNNDRNFALGYLSADALYNPHSPSLDGSIYLGKETAQGGYSVTYASMLDGDQSNNSIMIGGNVKQGAWRYSAGLSYYEEEGNFLGTSFSDAFGAIEASQTTSLHLGANWRQGNYSGFMRGSLGQSNVDFENDDGLFKSFDNVQTSSFAIGVGMNNMFFERDRFDIALGQKLRIESGSLSYNPDVLDAKAIDLAPSDREMLYELAYRVPITDNLFLTADYVYRQNPGNSNLQDDDQAFFIKAELNF